MSKFNTSKKQSFGTSKSSAKNMKKNGRVDELVIREILRASKYFKKIESNIRKIIDKDSQK